MEISGWEARNVFPWFDEYKAPMEPVDVLPTIRFFVCLRQGFWRYVEVDHDNYIVGSFGDSPKLATELTDLVVAGIKSATASLARDYGRRREPMPKPGDFVMMLDRTGTHSSSGISAIKAADRGGRDVRVLRGGGGLPRSAARCPHRYVAPEKVVG
jgi:hypothetical protein